MVWVTFMAWASCWVGRHQEGTAGMAIKRKIQVTPGEPFPVARASG